MEANVEVSEYEEILNQSERIEQHANNEENKYNKFIEISFSCVRWVSDISCL